MPTWPHTPARPRRMVVAALAALAVVVGLASAVAALALNDPQKQHSGTQQKKMEVHVSEFGVRFGMRTTFDEAVTLSSASLRAGGARGEANLWPLDDRDHEGEDLDPLTLAAGTPVSIEGRIRPECDGSDPGRQIVFSVRSRTGNGKAATRRFSASNPEILLEAAKTWCAQGPHVGVGRSSIWPNGDAVIQVRITNPGPDAIAVEIPAYADQQVSWTAASATVPEGEDVDVVVRGTGVACEPGVKGSWQEGRLLIDGEPFVVTSEDGWC